MTNDEKDIFKEDNPNSRLIKLTSTFKDFPQLIYSVDHDKFYGKLSFQNSIYWNFKYDSNWRNKKEVFSHEEITDELKKILVEMEKNDPFEWDGLGLDNENETFSKEKLNLYKQSTRIKLNFLINFVDFLNKNKTALKTI
jgi:hypothetical protein